MVPLLPLLLLLFSAAAFSTSYQLLPVSRLSSSRGTNSLLVADDGKEGGHQHKYSLRYRSVLSLYYQYQRYSNSIVSKK